MQPRIAHLLFVGILVLTFRASVVGQTINKLSTEQLQTEIAQRLQVLQKSFDRVQGKSLLRVSVDYDKAKQQQKQRGEDISKITDQGLRVTEIREISFAVSGQYRQCELKTPAGAAEEITSHPGKSNEPLRSVFSMGPRGSFALKWLTLDSSPEIKSFTVENSDPNSRYATYVDAFLHCPYSLPFGRVADLLQNSNFKIDRIETVNIDGHDCLRAFFEWVSPPKATGEKSKSKPSRLVGSFVVDAALSYALRSFEYSVSDKPQINYTADVEYQPHGAADDLPLPKQVEIVVNKSLRRIMTFEQLTRTTVPDTQFTLTAYVLPEMDRPIGDGNRNALPYWLAGSAAALLGLAGWLRHRSRTKVA